MPIHFLLIPLSLVRRHKDDRQGYQRWLLLTVFLQVLLGWSIRDSTDKDWTCDEHSLDRPQAPGASTNASSIIRVCDYATERAAFLVTELAKKSIESRGAFAIAIAGGSLVQTLAAIDIYQEGWDKWHVAWVDERCVPHDHKESNCGGAQSAWLSKIGEPGPNVYKINASDCAEGHPNAKAAAQHYDQQLKAIPEAVLPRNAGLPVFDLLLLGFGTDGHMCSLFPKHPLVNDNYTLSSWILPITDSPKPPPERITFSLPVVNSAKQIVFVGTGEGKAEVIQAIFDPSCCLELKEVAGVKGCQLPAAKALGSDPKNSPTQWILDEKAASLLPIGASVDKLGKDLRQKCEKDGVEGGDSEGRSGSERMGIIAFISVVILWFVLLLSAV